MGTDPRRPTKVSRRPRNAIRVNVLALIRQWQKRGLSPFNSEQPTLDPGIEPCASPMNRLPRSKGS
jgi:hypothetical protein